jgi:hypothetical protein
MRIEVLWFQLGYLGLGPMPCAVLGQKKDLILFRISTGYLRARGNTRDCIRQTSGRIRVLLAGKNLCPCPYRLSHVPVHTRTYR